MSITTMEWPTAPSDWPEDLRAEFVASLGNGRVGTRLVSESDRVRVWHLILKPGERIGFHTHVLDYFWSAISGGQARSHHSDGRVVEATYKPGDTQHHRYAKGEFMIHDLENIGNTDLVFATVEFLNSPNVPLVIAK
jgi:beta-alanine degradation protein BauB